MRVDEVAMPTSLGEASIFLRRRPDAIPCAGNTLLSIEGSSESSRAAGLALVCTHAIPELAIVSKSDRFIELGSATTLSRILSLPDADTLEPLKKVIITIASTTVRNLATIGGNIGSRNAFGSLFPLLAGLDASIEARDAQGTRWISVHALVSDEFKPAVPDAAIFIRIRIPLRKWDASCIIRKGDGLVPGNDNYTFCALACFDKEIISDLRIMAAGDVFIRDRSLEIGIIGKKLPLSQKEIESARHAFLEAAVDRGGSTSLAIPLADAVQAFLLNASGDSL